MSQPCIFCLIVTGQAPAVTLYEDNQTLAFLDINPINDGHTLVIPRQHHQDIHSMDEATYRAVAETTRRLTEKIHASLQPDGINLFQANGKAAGQTVFHFHNHILPRYADDKMVVEVHGKLGVDHAELEQLAERIRQHL